MLCSVGSGCSPSSNNCLLASVWGALFETTPEEEDDIADDPVNLAEEQPEDQPQEEPEGETDGVAGWEAPFNEDRKNVYANV